MRRLPLFEQFVNEINIMRVRRQFVDTGKIPQSEFPSIIDAANGKTAYAIWLAKKVADGFILPEDIYKWKEYLEIFNRRKRDFNHSDINKYKTANDVYLFRKEILFLKDQEKSNPSLASGKSKKDKYKSLLVGKVEGFDVYKIPQGREDLYDASCELGSGTEWCTATGNTRRYYDTYNKADDIFIFINDRGTKYQYSGDDFMDKDDNPVDYGNTLFYKMMKYLERERQIDDLPTIFKITHEPSTLYEWEKTFSGNLDLANTSIRMLPNGLIINGDLNISNTLITELPSELTVYGDIYARGLKKIKMPKAKMHWGLYMEDCVDVIMKDTLTIDNNLVLSGTKNVIFPEKGIRIGGHLDMNSVENATFPSQGEMYVARKLDMMRSSITHLRGNIRIGGNLLLNYSDVETISPNIEIGGGLDMTRTPLYDRRGSSNVINDLVVKPKWVIPSS